jgi:hypothetical protein
MESEGTKDIKGVLVTTESLKTREGKTYHKFHIVDVDNEQEVSLWDREPSPEEREFEKNQEVVKVKALCKGKWFNMPKDVYLTKVDQVEDMQRTLEAEKTEEPKQEHASIVEAKVMSQTEVSELEKMDLAEARDIAQNSDLVLQYEAPFKNSKTGKTEMRKFLGTNAFKLGFIHQYIKQGWSVSISYKDEKTEGDVVRVCKIVCKKENQIVEVEGKYAKSRLRSFLSPAKEECFDTFSFRNAIKRITSMEDIVTAAKVVQEDMTKMGMLPTREVQ